MQLFFSTLSELESFTHSLNTLSKENACQFCQQNDQWVSHGFIYKQLSYRQRNIVGKRILCSPHGNHSGCGRTRQLYLDTQIPGRRYSLLTLLAFVLALLHGMTVKAAWYHAIGHDRTEPRQAWRWLTALMNRLGAFRLKLKHRVEASCQLRTRRLRMLLPTLQALLQSLPDKSTFQSTLQMHLC